MRRFDEGPETERLRLRAGTVDDAEAFFRLNGDPEVMRYTEEPLLPSIEAARANLAAYPDFDRHGFGRWMCVEKSTGEVVGACGLKRLEDLGGVVDIGFRFLPSRWGLGYATEAGRATMAFGFEVLGLDEIVGFVLQENTASIRVLEKLGLTLDGPFDYDGVACLRYAARRPR